MSHAARDSVRIVLDVVDSEDGIRLDRVISDRMNDMSRSYAQQLMKSGERMAKKAAVKKRLKTLPNTSKSRQAAPDSNAIRMAVQVGSTGEWHSASVPILADPVNDQEQVLVSGLRRLGIKIQLKGAKKNTPITLALRQGDAFLLARQLLRQCSLVAPIDTVVSSLSEDECVMQLSSRARVID